MDINKKIIKVLKFQDLILSQPNRYISISRVDTLENAGSASSSTRPGPFFLKFPRIFHIYEHPVQRILYCRLSPDAHRQIADENAALDTQIPDAITRLRKLLMPSNSSRLRLEHIRVARKDFGLQYSTYSSASGNNQFSRAREIH
ncbi:protein ROOT PRIMORDIUM DEFECTIVE 1-like [Aristolochia californica]|uniref:protein ROOT PRIMORDIUM DEFECTIVE 1-like n=1 Tax=Aristolochia californica TaxID=171875 RepID=UPI0035DA09CE